jgi:hypothetical protein
MAKTPKIRIIRDRRREIEQEISEHREFIARHQDALKALETKASELEITERVLLSLESGDDDEADHAPAPAPKTESSGTKPAGLPIVPDMIIEALRSARESGGRGLEAKDILAYIDKRWWPGVPMNSIGPIAWRMAMKDRERRVIKRGKRYFLPEEKNQDPKLAVAS